MGKMSDLAIEINNTEIDFEMNECEYFHRELSKKLKMAMEEFEEFEKHPHKFSTCFQDEDFKRRHLAYMSEKIMCYCGFVTSRKNMSSHRESRNHQNRMIEYCLNQQKIKKSSK
jgi:hypothetical protein